MYLMICKGASSRGRVKRIGAIAAFCGTGLIALIEFLFCDPVRYDGKVGFGRQSRGRDKLSKFDSNIYLITDEIKKMDFTIYRIGSRRSRMKFLLVDYPRRYRSAMGLLRKMIAEREELDAIKDDLCAHYYLRIPHFIWYQRGCEHVVDHCEETQLYTADILDAFLQMERAACRERGKTLICVPHGRPPLQSVPGYYMGDVNYCPSEYTAKRLNDLYPGQLHIVDEKVNERVYRYGSVLPSRNLSVTYFSSYGSPEEDDLICELGQRLGLEGITLRVKLHPQYSATALSLQANDQLCFINDYSSAIAQTVCVAETSTALSEAKYNHSIPISTMRILGRIEDEEILADQDILKPETIDELVRLVENYVSG